MLRLGSGNEPNWHYQVHRKEEQIFANIRLLLESGRRAVPPLDNVPNRYLQPKARG